MRVFLLGVMVAVAAIMPASTMADDQQIADFIKARLMQEKQQGNLFGFNVDMRVDKGSVWFKGFVSNRSQELLILRTAQLAGHLGVVQVVDDIDVNNTNGRLSPLQPQVQPSNATRADGDAASAALYQHVPNAESGSCTTARSYASAVLPATSNATFTSAFAAGFSAPSASTYGNANVGYRTQEGSSDSGRRLSRARLVVLKSLARQ